MKLIALATLAQRAAIVLLAIMSLEEIKSEIENLTSKSISEVIEFAIQIRDQRDSAAAQQRQMDENNDSADSKEHDKDSK